MDTYHCLHYIRRVLPEVDVLNNETQKIMSSTTLDNQQKVVEILSNHFKARTSKNLHPALQRALKTEAKLINKLFPSLDFMYIYHLLESFKDMSNRKEIVLRTILHSKFGGRQTQNPSESTGIPPKRAHVQLLNNENYNPPSIKIRKLEELMTTNVEKPKLETVVTNDFLLKPSTVTSTITSSSVGKAVNLELPSSNLESEPYASTSKITYDYEIPNVTEHFDLPVLNLSSGQNSTDVPNLNGQLSVGRNCTVGLPDQVVDSDSVKSELPDDIAEIAVDLSSKYETISQPVNLGDFKFLHNIDIQSESSSGSVIQVPDDNVQIEHPLDDVPFASKERESQDSNATEVYSPSVIVPDDAIPVAEHYTVKVVSPTTLKIKKSFTSDTDLNNAERQREQTSATTHIPDVTPSTSRQDSTNMNAVPTPFDLLEYVREITNAPVNVIKKYCKRLLLPTDVKPTSDLLNILVDQILTNSVDSESSDVEDVSENDIEFLGNENADFSEPGSSTNNTTQNQNILCTTKKQQENSSNESTKTAEFKNLDMQLVNHLCSIFPDACPKYIKGLCCDKVMNNEVLDDIITIILDANNDYPKRPKPPPEPEIIPENQFEILKEVLPDADPDYLRMMCDQCEGRPDMLKTFLNNAMEKKNYPTFKDYQRRQQLSAQQKQYTTDFDVENFLKVIPDPHTFFSDPSRKIKLSATDAHYALVFLRNKYNKLPIRLIQGAFTKNDSNIPKCIKHLNKAMAESSLQMKSVRKPMDMPNNITNIPLLQELAYYMHEKEIDNHLKQLKQKEESERLEAKNQGLLKTCSCCYDEEVFPRDIYCCQNGCEFCKSCIIKSSEVRFGEGKLDFPCLMNCSSSFSLQTLQAVLSPKLFSKVAQKKALEEVKAAGIEDLETCPFCDFATIPAEGYNIFTCMNPECMKESCRMCKEPSHIPLRCDEIEKDEDVRARTFVENKMTEALLKKCYKCGVKFFKEEGCNKMTCSCGAQMCYVCGQPVTSYKHFNGNGGDRYDLCPLYSDTNVLNKENVLKGAEEAKAEIGNVSLKHDPTADLNRHYEERKKKYPQAHMLVGQQAPLPPQPPQRPPVYRHQVYVNRPNPPRNMDDAMDALMMRLFDAFEQRRH